LRCRHIVLSVCLSFLIATIPSFAGDEISVTNESGEHISSVFKGLPTDMSLSLFSGVKPVSYVRQHLLVPIIATSSCKSSHSAVFRPGDVPVLLRVVTPRCIPSYGGSTCEGHYAILVPGYGCYSPDGASTDPMGCDISVSQSDLTARCSESTHSTSIICGGDGTQGIDYNCCLGAMSCVNDSGCSTEGGGSGGYGDPFACGGFGEEWDTPPWEKIFCVPTDY
jgi:hypothetical protein